MRVVLLAVMVVAGCRLDTAPEPSDSAGDRTEADRVGTVVPPVASGDTARPTEDGAANRTGQRAASGWLIPVVGVAPSELVDTFQAARSQGRTHDAIDIPAPRGTPVVAARPGRVAQLFTSDKGGLTVYVIGADDRTVTYYAHLDATADGLAEGQQVRAGDPIGTVGDSGNAAPGNTHLHFAIWRVTDPADVWDGTPVNPYPLLTGPH